MITSLLQIAKSWLNSDYPLRQQAIKYAAPEFCLSSASFELALDWIFSLWTENTLSTHLKSHAFKQHRYAAQVLAGTTPAMIAQGFLQGALLQVPQCLKIPSQQSTFARLLLQSFEEVSSDLAKLFELTVDRKRLYECLMEADLVFVYGEDETVSMIKTFLAPEARLVAHGHAESVAVIFKEAANPTSLEKLGYDFLSYDQRGCLSPCVVFIEQGGELSPADCARVFAEDVVPSFSLRFPRGGLFPGEAEAILHQRNLAGFRGQVYCGEDWTVSFDEVSVWPEVRLPRFLRFKPFASRSELEMCLKPVLNHLICVGYSGAEIRPQDFKLHENVILRDLGEMQKQLLIF